MGTTWNKPKIFIKGEFAKALAKVPFETAIEFRTELRKKVLDANPSGKFYERGRGTNFKASHQASARGQRFANDTGKTLKSLKVKKTGELQAVVEFESKVAEHLIKMDRIVISDKDEKDGLDLMVKKANIELKKIL